jgi:disulfide bond formation protein DsbB
MLCLWQRFPYYGAALPALAMLALLARPGHDRALGWLALGLALIFLVSTGLGLYHAGVEWKIFPPPAGCSAANAGLNPLEIGSLDQPLVIPRCNEAPWHFIGLSMAGWNGVISLMLAGISFAAAAITLRSYRTA